MKFTAAKVSALFASLRRKVHRSLIGLKIYYRPLGMRGVLAFCCYRFLGWPKEFAVKTAEIRHPLYLRLRTTDVAIYEEVLLRSQYAFSLPFVPKTIVDAGANNGMASVYYANQYPDARIVAIEAEVSNFEMLVRNVTPYANIVPIHAALWNKDGQVAVEVPDWSENPFCKMSFVAREAEGAQVRALTIPTLMNEMGMFCIDLLKVNIEGAEKEVFGDGAHWMENVRCLAVELHDRFRAGCSEAVGSATRDFTVSQKGETTIYIRESPAKLHRFPGKK